MRTLWHIITVIALTGLAFCSTGCTEKRAQVAVQTALTAAAEGVDATDQVVDEALPAAVERAGNQASEECAGSCPDPMAIAVRLLEPWTNAVTGLRHAVNTLQALQSGLNLWIATGQLPDWGPLCTEAEATYGSLLALIAATGLQPPALLSTVAPHIDTVCTTMAAFIASRRGGE